MRDWYAPLALHRLYDAITLESKELSGILGDAKHFSDGGYHVPRAACAGDDYSVQYPADKLGNASAASALDVRLSPEDMKRATRRLIAACQANDPRVHPLREVYGTVNGVRVVGWDRHAPDDAHDDAPSESDPTHIWHLHVGVYRFYCDNIAALAGIAAVINGDGLLRKGFTVTEAKQLHDQIHIVAQEARAARKEARDGLKALSSQLHTITELLRTLAPPAPVKAPPVKVPPAPVKK